MERGKKGKQAAVKYTVDFYSIIGYTISGRS
jgi:hypothetical protein